MSFSKLLDDFFMKVADSIQIGIPAKILSFDGSTMRANVQPFGQVKDGNGATVLYPILNSIPVQFIYSGGYYIKPSYQPNDMVWVTFSSHDIWDALRRVNTDSSKKLFSMDNACVSGGIADASFSAPPEFSSETGLIIGEKSGNSYMVYAADSIKMKFNAGATEIKFSAAGIDCDSEVTANKKTLPIALSTHKHNFTGMGSVGTPLP